MWSLFMNRRFFAAMMFGSLFVVLLPGARAAEYNAGPSGSDGCGCIMAG